MEHEDSNSTINESDAESYVDAWENMESDHSLCISNLSSISNLNDINTSSIQSKETPESTSSSSDADLCDRQLVSRKSLNEFSPSHSYKNDTDRLVDFDSHGFTMSAGDDCQISWKNEESKSKLSSTRIHASSGSVRELLNEETNGNSAITSVNDDERINDGSITADSPVSGSNFIFALAGFVIKVIGFQLNLLVSSITLPIWLVYFSYMFVTDPFRIMRRAKYYVVGNISRICGVCYGCVKWTMYMWIRKHESTWKLCLQIGWGLLWSVYVGFILISLLVFAFVISGIILKCIMDEPIKITEQLNFDYTKESPTAFVPLMSCPEPSFLEHSEPICPGCTAESRVLPLDHRVHVTVSLSLPESDYNRNLGVFQVRVDFLSGNGKRLASTRQPCMLHFKSQPIRLLLTFLNLAPLITGYSSESQTLNIKFRGYTETSVPTSCLKVILEQRAEFTRGRGVPEIYTAFLKLESQPPFLKRILWSWKGTIYVWVSVMIFGVELLFTLVCCTPIILPWIQPRGISSNNIVARSTGVGPK
ncbi:seipin-3-like [Cynara cardunculus var. scolymus]|uniref:Adipose-regulatory protein, Seipin n=1 Tax=Cynara cardunculus var. scolymus TaxID=59895 RepID=A0A103XTY6_CYNCS|nr:seipin-3-like [Cynara cardunculus var. scolymus]KVH96793.1 hypothetical protein Ccrd_001114 [Cynara cardunculus var. scolymus]